VTPLSVTSILWFPRKVAVAVPAAPGTAMDLPQRAPSLPMNIVEGLLPSAETRHLHGAPFDPTRM